MNKTELKEKIRDLLKNNTEYGYSKLLKTDYCYIKPSPGPYPFQWFWDTCFHIFILCRLEEYKLAKDNLESLFKMQDKDGFIGHMIFWNRVLPTNKMDVLQAHPRLTQLRPHMSALIQPTFLAQTLLHLHKGINDMNFLNKMLPKIENYHKWLINNRDFDNDGLLTIITTFESGMDFKPSYDPVIKFPHKKGNLELYIRTIYIDLRNFLNGYNLKKIRKKNYFLVKDVGVNTIYALDLYALSKLFELTKNIEKSRYFLKKAKKVQQAILDKMYNKKDSAFYDIYGKDEKQLKIKTPTIVFPVSLPGMEKEICDNILEKNLLNNQEFAVPYPFSSVSISDPSFNPNSSRFIWRGPTWIFYNWFLSKCLKSKSYDKEAKHVYKKTLELIEKSGFREYYNPLTGEGYGAKDFTWSGLILDME